MPIYTAPPAELSPVRRALIFAGKCIVAAAFIAAMMGVVAVVGLSLNVGR